MSIDFSDQNLLFAIIMLRNGFVEQDQFVEVLNQWSENKPKSVSELVIENGWLEDDDTSAIERLMGRQIQRHGSIESSITHHAQELDFSSIQISDESVRNLLQSSTIHGGKTKGNGNSNTESADANLDLTATSVSRDSSDTDASDKPKSDPGLSATAATRSDADDFSVDTKFKPQQKSSGTSRFSILRPHAKGGLGKVSVALDMELDREVALKEIRSSYADDQMSRDRFVLEACITGGLEHPGVVPVYGFGKKDDGSPYFAMRFIRGQTLKEAVLEYHGTYNGKDAPGKRLEFRNLLTRFVDACNAVAYAHNRGVIHRDIKPSNIMLGKFGETLVVDWGLAKNIGRDEAYEDSDSSMVVKGGTVSGTLDGSTVGTPTFMSPEQAAGRLEEMRPASDIYSLGSTLYFILTGKTAFTGSNATEVVALVRENDFQPPRERNSGTPKALDAICCKAMSTKPENRYPTALLLASDVENWMADEPVSAHKEPWLARSGRWLRHHRTLATSAAVLTLTITVASLVGMVMVNAEKNRTVAAKNKTEKALVELEQAQLETKSALAAETKARRQTRDVLNTVTDDLVGELMARQVELGDADRAFFARVLGQFEEFTNTTGESKDSQNIRADGYFRVGNLQRRLDDLEAAATAYHEAETIWTSLADSNTEPDFRQDLAAVNANQAMLLAQLGNHKEAIDKETKAASLLQGLIDEYPDRANYQIDLAKLLGNRGNAFFRIGELEKAENDYDKSVRVYEDLVKKSDDFELKRYYAHALSNLAGLCSKQNGRLGESESLYQKVVAQLSELVSRDGSAPALQSQLALERQNLGNVMLLQKRTDDAVDQFRSAIQTQVALTNKYPALASYRRELGRSRLGLGQALNQLGLDGSEKELLNAQSITTELVSDFPQRVEFKKDLATIYDQLGAHYRKGETSKAQQMYQLGLDLRLKIEELDPENQVLADQAIAAEINFANFLRLSDDFDPAIERYQSVLSKLESRDNPAGNLIRVTVFGLGDSFVKAAKYDEALKCWTRLVKNRQDPAWKTFELQRAICSVRVGEIADGLSAADAILAAKKPDGLTCYDVACCYAVAARVEKDKEKIEAFAKRGVELLEQAGEQEFFDDQMKKHAAKDVDLDSLRQREDFKKVCAAYKIPLDSTDF